MIKIDRKLFLSFVLMMTLITPVTVFAQPQVVPPTAVNQDPLTLVVNVLDVVLKILWVIAISFVIIMFTLAGFKFLTAQGDPSKISEARLAVIWGTVGTTVIVLAWSMVTIMRVEFGV